MASSEHPRIFVQIPSYRDEQCQWTVKDLFEKATHPERIFVGICWQYSPTDDAHCFKEPYPYPDQVRLLQFDVKDSKGCCWARDHARSLWRGEEYTLQIDSHMRFVQGWDEMMIAMLDACDSPKPLLTCYPPHYAPDQPLQEGFASGLAPNRFDADSIVLYLRWCNFPKGYFPPKPFKGSVIAAGFLFAPSEMFVEVPQDPHLYFHGEEISLATRLWTHGWDFFHPNRPVIYHHYNQERHEHSQDQQARKRAAQRLNHMLGVERHTDPEILLNIDSYGLGTARTLAQYQAFSGIDFAARTLSTRAREGIFMDEFRDVGVTCITEDLYVWIEHMLKNGTEAEEVKRQLYWAYYEKDVDAAVEKTMAKLAQENTVPFTITPPPTPYRAFDFELRRWVAGSLIAGCDKPHLHGVLVSLGIDPAEADRELDEALASPFLPEGQNILNKKIKREWLLSMLDRQFRMAGKYGGEIPRIKTPKFKEFLKHYYYENVPVILKDAIKRWPARKWTPQLLKQRIGHAMIQVQFGREGDKDYERKSWALRRNMQMSEYIDLVLATPSSNDFYMTASNWPECKHAFTELYNDIGTIKDGYLNDAIKLDQAFIWVGPAGTITPLHHDLSNNLFVQVYGRKRFILIPSTQVKDCYNNDFVYSDVDIFNIDYEKFPDLKRVTIIDVVLNPGETLLIPNGWLHAVQALDTSISITFTNFNAENGLNDGYPMGRRY